MSEEEKGGEQYVRKVHEETRRFTQDLLNENEKLRLRITALQKERRDLEEELGRVRSEIENHRREGTELKRHLTEVEEENHRFSEKYLEVEEQNSNLANLYVASYRLHGTLDRQEILNTIQEIIINLVGSEEIGIFELDSDKSTLSLAASVGIDAERYRSVPVGSGPIGEAARTGEPYLEGVAPSGDESGLTACIPLKVEGRVNGVIAVFRLLPQKSGLRQVDRELFDLLAAHAAMALYCAQLHIKMAAAIDGRG